MVKFVISKNYEINLSRIEDYIYSSTKTLVSVKTFLEAHDRALLFLSENPNVPAIHPETNEQSWNFGNGRYRLFFKRVEDQGDIIVYLIHLIDNKEVNLDVYPNNKIPTFDEN